MQSVTSNAVAVAMLFNPKLHITDTRDSNFAPGYYLATYGGQTVQEFKNTSVINTPFNTGSFCTLITMIPWADLSGGFPTQFAINTYINGEIKYRVASDANNWGAWAKIVNQNDISSAVFTVDTARQKINNAQSKLIYRGNKLGTIDIYDETGSGLSIDFDFDNGQIRVYSVVSGVTMGQKTAYLS